jgi:hypothetical protein
MSFLRIETIKLLHWVKLASFLCRPPAIEWGHLSVPVLTCSFYPVFEDGQQDVEAHTQGPPVHLQNKLQQMYSTMYEALQVDR